MNRLWFRIKRWMRFRYMRYTVSMKQSISDKIYKSNQRVTDLDLVAQEAIRKAIWDKESTLLSTNGIRYVKVPSKKISVILEDNYATITNSVYSYRFHINEDIYKHLCEIFENVVSKRAKAIDDEVFTGVKSNVKTILKEL